MVLLKRKKATKAWTHGGVTHIRLYNTDVVRFNRHKVALATGRWMTSTTKNRMNQAAKEYGLGYTVEQKNFQWFVRRGDKLYPFVENEEFRR
jgi:glycerol-3-phosphate dehydrogenase